MSRASQEDHNVDRRRLLRRAAAAAVTTAGASVAAAAALPGAAEAAAGDSLLMGQDNDAGTATTTLQSQYGDAALVLTNPEGVPLRLVPSANLYPAVFDQPVGTVAIDTDGDMFIHPGAAGGTDRAWVWTTNWATTSVPVPPTRVLDTRDAALRANIVSGQENLDPLGRLKANGTIVVSLDAYVLDGHAMKGNITVTETTGPGFLTVWGSGAKPTASTLNWWSKGQILSNFVFTAMGAQGTFRSVVAISTNSVTHVILDLTSLLVSHPSQVLLGSATKADQLPTVAARRGDVAAPRTSN